MAEKSIQLMKLELDREICYRKRNIILLEMGFESYSYYLRSPLWNSIRKKCFAIFGDTCWFCGGKATEIHHMKYNRTTLEGSNFKYLIPLGHRCHQWIEFEGSQLVRREFVAGAKVSAERATSNMWSEMSHCFGRDYVRMVRRVRNEALRDK